MFFLFLDQNICCGYSKEPSQILSTQNICFDDVNLLMSKYLQMYAENFCFSLTQKWTPLRSSSRNLMQTFGNLLAA